MLADGRTVPDGEVLDAEVCVIGAGPSGITIALELSSAGIDVILIERGDRKPHVPRAVPDTVLNVGIPYDVADSRAFEVGGTAHTWGVKTPLGDGFGRFRELDPEDFEARSWIPMSGWPFDKRHLDPLYRRARSLLDWNQAESSEKDLPNHRIDHPMRDTGASVAQRTFLFGNPGVFPGEMSRKLEVAGSVLVLTNSAAREIRSDGSGPHVSSIEVMTAGDHSYRVRAKAYVVAAGGIETPRLLLASRSRHSNGIGNTNDLVGRYFMEHPHYDSGVLITKQNPVVFGRRDFHSIRLHNGVPMQPTYSLSEDVVRSEELNRSVFRFDSVPIGYISLPKEARLSLEAAGELRRTLRKRSRPASGYLSAVKSAARGAADITQLAISRGVEQLRAESGDRWFRMVVMSEQSPNRDSRVGLIDERDRLGMPMGALNWQLTTEDLVSMRRSQELIAEQLAADGHPNSRSFLREGQLPKRLIGGHHHMGTTRMSVSPRRGVVDSDSRVHGVDNLYVAGSAVFPTSGYANPTLTLLALTLRLGDHLKGELSSG